jgi:hypothetical protein
MTSKCVFLFNVISISGYYINGLAGLKLLLNWTPAHVRPTQTLFINVATYNVAKRRCSMQLC